MISYPSATPPLNRKVVITGMGAISSIGLSLKEIKQSLQNRTCGITYLEDRKNMGFRSSLSGIIRDFSITYPLDRRYRKTLPEFGLWAWEAISQALDSAGVDLSHIASDERTGFIFGNDSSVVTGVDQCSILKDAENTREIGSGHIFRLLTSTITLNLSTKLQIRGSSWTVSGACASGAMSIGQGAELIANGSHDMVICGGAQEISWQSMCSFDALGAFSLREDSPQQSSRPFDSSRDGLVPSGGAAAIILESEKSARKRGAAIIGEVCGYGTTSDGSHLSVPTGEGLQRAMAMALNKAGISPEQIDLVMAHATSTPAGDEKEAEAICNIFSISRQGEGPYVAATKSLTGHEFWMAGASQVVYALLMAKHRFIAGHPNYNSAADYSALLKISQETVQASPVFILCNAAGFGGVNASLVVRFFNAN